MSWMWAVLCAVYGAVYVLSDADSDWHNRKHIFPNRRFGGLSLPKLQIGRIDWRLDLSRTWADVLMRFRAKVDANHGEIVKAIRDMGASVESLAPMGNGLPDLLVGIGRQIVLIEVKSEKGKLNRMQIAWKDKWRGPEPYIVRSVDDAVTLINNLRAYDDLPCFVRVH